MNSGSSLVDPLDATSGTLWDPQLKSTTLCKFTRHLFQKLQFNFLFSITNAFEHLIKECMRQTNLQITSFLIGPSLRPVT